MRTFRIALYAPDRAIVYDGRTPETTGVGGGITARLSMVTALAALGHEVTAYVHCEAPVIFAGVSYVPVTSVTQIDADILVAISTGGDLSFAPLRNVNVKARLKIVWVQGVPKPADIEAVSPDFVYVASNFLRDVCVDRWGVPASQLFVSYNGIRQGDFARAAADAVPRDPFALAYVGPPEKGLDACIEVLRRLRAADDRYHLDVFGGSQLWGRAADAARAEPGLTFRGLLGQAALVPALFGYEYGLALQAMEEGFGIGVQEARRAGQIVFASAVGAFPELVRDGVDGYLIEAPHSAPEAHAQVAECILQLAGDTTSRESLRQNAMQTPWDWDLAARTWTAHWAWALATPSSATLGATAILRLPDGTHSTFDGRYVPAPELWPPPAQGEAHPPRVLIAGYYGHGNLGDEAILACLLRELRGDIPQIDVTVVSGHPETTRDAHRVAAVHERDWPALIDAASATDLIVIGGGGLFHDHFGVDEATLLDRSHWGLTLFAAFPLLARLLSRKLMLCAVGVGPIASAEGARLTRLAFAQADRITVRDSDSVAVLRAIGVSRLDIEVTADPVTLNEPAPAARAQELLEQAGVPADRPLIVVALRHWDGDILPAQWHAAVASALDALVADIDAAVLFVPFQSGHEGALTDDAATGEAVRNAMRRGDATYASATSLSAADVQGLMVGARLVVAMRLHAVILASNVAAPIVALAYDDKVRRAMAQVGCGGQVLTLGEASAEAIVALARDVWQQRPGLRDRMVSSHNALRDAARRNVRIAAELLQAPGATRPPLAPEHADVMLRALLLQTKRAAVHETGVDYLRGLLEDRTRELADLKAAHAETTSLLAVRTDELSQLGSTLNVLSTDLTWKPEHSYRRARRWLRRTRRRIASTTGHTFARIAGPPARGVRAVYLAVVPAPVRVALARAVARRLMGAPEYAFDRFKRARIAAVGSDVAALRAPGSPGLVSVILPAYNGAEYIRESIESVRSQTYALWELVIVDDGSTDATPVIADHYARLDRRIRVIHQANQKLPAALSRGFRAAHGEWLTWTSCDNRMLPACLEQLVACLERHPDWDLTYANLDMIGEDGTRLLNNPIWGPDQYPPGSGHVHLPTSTAALNVVANNSVGAAFLYRNRVASLLGDYSPYRFVMEDYDYWMRANALMTVRHADVVDPLYEYRFHGQSLTARWEELRMLQNRDRLMVFEDFRRDFGLSPALWAIDGDVADLAEALRACVRRAGHRLVDGRFSLADLPTASLPVVRVWVTSRPSAPAPALEAFPAGALRVLLTDSIALPLDVAGDWDLCCAQVADDVTLPRVGQSHQGWLGAPDTTTLFRAIDIRLRAAHLGRMEAIAEAGPAPTVTASVVICARYASTRLTGALHSVARQSMPTTAYEVIVVSNNPDEAGIRNAVDALRAAHFAACPDHARYVLCPITGLSAARNAGIAEARGEVVCFLDDDAVASEDWLSSIVEAFAQHPRTGVIGGHIRLNIPDPRPRALQPGWEKYWSQYLTEYPAYTEVSNWRQFPWGASWSARRAALRAIGGFRLGYGRSGNNYWGGEELVAACLIQRLGFAIAIEPRAEVLHDVAPERFTFTHVRRTIAAGYHVGRLAQRDMYLPPGAAGLRAALSQLVSHWFDRTVPAGRYRWRDAAYRKSAQLAQVAAGLADLARRGRRPIVSSRRSA